MSLFFLLNPKWSRPPGGDVVTYRPKEKKKLNVREELEKELGLKVVTPEPATAAPVIVEIEGVALKSALVEPVLSEIEAKLDNISERAALEHAAEQYRKEKARREAEEQQREEEEAILAFLLHHL